MSRPSYADHCEMAIARCAFDEPEDEDVLEQDIVKRWEGLLAARKPGVRLPVEWDTEIEEGLEEIKALRALAARVRNYIECEDEDRSVEFDLMKAALPDGPTPSAGTKEET